jgi:hypothetical protein
MNTSNLQSGGPDMLVRTSKHAPKRTAAQRAADLLYAEEHHLRGYTHAQIASRLSKERGYTISRPQIAYDLKKLEAMWIEDAKQSLELAKARAIKALALQEAAAWNAWLGEDSATNPQVKSSRAGDPAFLKLILEVHDRRVKLLGLDAPTCVRIEAQIDPPVEEQTESRLSGEEEDELIKRHYERIMRQRAKASGVSP